MESTSPYDVAIDLWEKCVLNADKDDLDNCSWAYLNVYIRKMEYLIEEKKNER